VVFDRIDLLGWCPGPKDRKEYHLRSRGYKKHMCDGHRFPMRLARLAAGRLCVGCLAGGSSLRDYAVVVLCGRLVAGAFGLKLRASVPWAEETDGIRYLVMPHPSGVSHFWNDEVNRCRAAAAFRAALQACGLRAGHLELQAEPSLQPTAKGPLPSSFDPHAQDAAASAPCCRPARRKRPRRWLRGVLSRRAASASPVEEQWALRSLPSAPLPAQVVVQSRFFREGHGEV